LSYALCAGRTTTAGVQNYCDTLPLGLDCVGFIYSYLKYTSRVLGAPLTVGGYRNTLRRTYDQIQQFDVLVWHDNSHIAMVHDRVPPWQVENVGF
jgi:hypothetical protein